MAYSLKTKKDIINKIHSGMTPSDASQIYSISYHTIRKWLKYPDKYLNDIRTDRRPFDIEEKIEVLRMVDEGGMTHRQVADLKKININTIRNWIKDKNRIFALYSSQGHTCLLNSPGEETESMSSAGDKDTKQHIRDLKDENEYLKAKVAYLEALMEINGTPVSGFKKNNNIRPSTKSSEEASET